MLLSQVVGQDYAKRGLIHFAESGHIPHAIMLEAKDGRGGLPLAIAYAQYLLCEQPISNELGSDACGHCSSCIKVEKLAHPDLHLAYPTITSKSGSKQLSKDLLPTFRSFFKEHPYGTVYDWLQHINAENKQGNISADECREIIDHLMLKAFEGKYKIQIIWQPEYLGKEGNILLKLIEEPPQDTIFLLVASDLEAVIATILSRTQLVTLRPLTDDHIAQALTTLYQVEASVAQKVAPLSEGNLTTALDLAHHNNTTAFDLLRQWFNGIFTSNAVMIHNFVDTMSKMGREQQKNFLAYTQILLGQVNRLTLIPNFPLSLTDEEGAFATKLAKMNFGSAVIGKMDTAIGEASNNIERNANSKIILLHLSVQLQYIIKGMELTSA